MTCMHVALSAPNPRASGVDRPEPLAQARASALPVWLTPSYEMQLGDKQGSCQEDPTKRAIVVQITNQCPECGPNHVDIQALTWAKVRSSVSEPWF